MTKRKTNTEFISDCVKTHGDEFDYNEVSYVNCETKVSIICHKKDSNGVEHGVFWQKPTVHLRGGKCPKCFGGVSIDREEFLKRAFNKHKDNFDYFESNYIKSNIKIKIKCNKCDSVFYQTPNSHLNGSGCPKCVGKFKTNEERIEDYNIRHNNKYDYSKTIYKSPTDKIIVTCPIDGHGDFLVTHNNHLNGRGCPKCKSSKMETDVERKLLKNNIKFETQKTFDWLRNPKTGRSLRLDFYLSDYNIAIECQGRQHFEVVEEFGGENEFRKTQERDNIKLKLCKENNIPIIYKPYNKKVN